MSDQTETSHVAEICLFEDALPKRLFDRLLHAVRSLGSERMKDNGSYSTTFWLARGAEPTNVAEQSVRELLDLVNPGPDCIGTEWWLGRLGYGKELRLHFDRDLTLRRTTGESVHPLLSSVLYLNDFPSSPTLILDQVLAADGKTRVPEKAEFGKSVEAIANDYVVFPGNLRHGVVPDPDRSKKKGKRRTPDLRMTLLVNFWHRRPSEPYGRDFDGTIYASLRDEEFQADAENPRLPR